MNGFLAQVIALASHGNAFLSSGEDATLFDLRATNSTFYFVGRLRFRMRDAESAGDAAVESTGISAVSDWYSMLRARGAVRMWPITDKLRKDEPDGVARAMTGGRRDGVVVEFRQGYEVWSATWTILSDSPDELGVGKPWDGTYEGERTLTAIRPPDVSLRSAKDELQAAVAKTRDYERQRMALQEGRDSFWLHWFDESLELLNSSHPIPPYYPNILPSRGYSLLARQIVAGAVRAEVFGGMGSWNSEPAPPGMESEYSSVGPPLFKAIVTGLLVAAASFEPIG